MKPVTLIPYPKQVTMCEGYAPADAPVRTELTDQLAPEAFCLTIRPEAITLQGGSRTALQYGEAALEQLRLQQSQLPCMEIRDWPSLPWRSFHIDSARHFIPLDELKKMVRMCAHFRLNRFHWHISDDQGWRIECRAFPKLHEIGSIRQGDHFDANGNDEVQGGYYTRAEVAELVAYCRDLGIEIVPELDLPGHVTAILAAYPQLSCRETPVAVETRGGIFREIFCAGKEETFAFIEQLLDDLLELFPGEYIHIGGDEAPKTHWKTCPHCQRRMAEEGLETLQQLQGYFMNRVIAHLKRRGRRAIVWNEAAYGGNLDPEAVIELWTEDRDQAVATHMRRGGKVMLANMMNCYCDYPYAFISLQSVYQLDTAPEGLVSCGREQILGTECLIWTERVRDAQRLETYAWPRFAASAEVGWCSEERPGYESFSQRLQALFPLFERYGIQATPSDGWVYPPEEARRILEELWASIRAGMEGLDEITDVQSEI